MSSFKNRLKTALKYWLQYFHLDVTKNLEYDRLTKQIIKETLRSDSNCIDAGCHKGEVLSSFLLFAPEGKHFGFEPVPSLFNDLKKTFTEKATIYPYALADKSEKKIFNIVTNALAYSGINRRKYDCAEPEIEEITVNTTTLDEIIPTSIKIDFIKIDVEGGEYLVLKGAEALLKRDAPVVIFEFGIGAADYYGSEPNVLYEYMVENIGYDLTTLKFYVKNKKALTKKEFADIYKSTSEYYFIAWKNP